MKTLPDDFIGQVPDIAPIWRERFRDMAMGVTWDGNRFTPIEKIRVNRNWPLTGTARFTRKSDGQRFEIKLFRKQNKWVVKGV